MIWKSVSWLYGISYLSLITEGVHLHDGIGGAFIEIAVFGFPILLPMFLWALPGMFFLFS